MESDEFTLMRSYMVDMIFKSWAVDLEFRILFDT